MLVSLEGLPAREDEPAPWGQARAMLAKAAARGSVKNITPNRLMATSNEHGSKGWTWTSAGEGGDPTQPRHGQVTVHVMVLRAGGDEMPMTIGRRPTARPW